MSKTLEVGNQLVEMCKQNRNHECIETMYSPDVVSVEAGGPPGQSTESRGIPAILGKGKWWVENHEVHSSSVDGPYPHGDRFIVKFDYDITFKPENRRFRLQEMALYTVADGKVVREEFFYSM